MHSNICPQMKTLITTKKTSLLEWWSSAPTPGPPGAHIFCWSRCCHKQGPMQAFITSQPNQKSTCDGYDESWYLGVYHIHRFSTSMCTECAHIDTTYRYVTTCLLRQGKTSLPPGSTSNFRGCKSPNQEFFGRSIPLETTEASTANHIGITSNISFLSAKRWQKPKA